MTFDRASSYPLQALSLPTAVFSQCSCLCIIINQYPARPALHFTQRQYLQAFVAKLFFWLPSLPKARLLCKKYRSCFLRSWVGHLTYIFLASEVVLKLET